MNARALVLLLVAAVAPDAAEAATLEGSTLGWPWELPFAGILITIALAPLASRDFWHHHYGKFAFAWAALTLGPLALWHGVDVAVAALAHALLGDYLGFIAILFALYVVAGGILVTGTLRGTPFVNALTLALGALIASIVGTTGAAMILIRPLLRANEKRQHKVHVVVFFIFLVGNIGGALSPLGDPPLFIGFLNGVDFFWPLRHLLLPTLFTAGCVLVIFLALDAWYFTKEHGHAAARAMIAAAVEGDPLRMQGLFNIALLGVIIGAVIESAVWSPGVSLTIAGTELPLQDLVRDAVLFLAALASLRLTPAEHRRSNGFSWEPILEVALLFAGIFVCAGPVLAMLAAGRDGSFGWLLNAVTGQEGNPRPIAFFWLTGVLSAILDNAPTYLVFFKLAGGDAHELMTGLTTTLAAISMGAVYMGALTYIGNAPNFMIYAIACERGIKMPSFFGYIGWSVAVLVPVFVLITWLFVAA